jgi:hypothetical protein
MIGTRFALLSFGTFLTVASCSSDDANLGDGTGAVVTGAGGAAGASGGEGKAGSSAGSSGSNSTGTGGCGDPNGIACAVDSGAGGAKADSGSGALTWHVTCGDPVCRVDVNGTDAGGGSDAGGTCTADQKEGLPCTMANEVCEPQGATCGQKLMCADHRLNVMCPISNRNMKQDISYLSSDDVQRLADEVAKVRLTTYTYRDPSLGTDEHLGFIIDDNPSSPAVYPNHHQVDLYGYTSMAVAALQVQEQKLRTQEQQIADLRRELAALRSELHR